MKNFEESLRRLSAPDLPVATFRRKLRRDLGAAHARLNARRWRRACFAACGLCVVLAALLAAQLGTIDPPTGALQAHVEVSVDSDREFVEAYYARQGSGVHVQSVDSERLVAIREFTMSDGQRMVVYTETDEGDDSRSAVRLEDALPMLATHATTTF